MHLQQNLVGLIKQFSGQAQVLTCPRVYVKLAGDHVSALTLSQIIYWSDRLPQDDDGWFAKPDNELAQELELSSKVLQRVRKNLGKLGIEHRRLGIPAQMHYRIDMATFMAKLNDLINPAPDDDPPVDNGAQDDLLFAPEDAGGPADNGADPAPTPDLSHKMPVSPDGRNLINPDKQVSPDGRNYNRPKVETSTRPMVETIYKDLDLDLDSSSSGAYAFFTSLLGPAVNHPQIKAGLEHWYASYGPDQIKDLLIAARAKDADGWLFGFIDRLNGQKTVPGKGQKVAPARRDLATPSGPPPGGVPRPKLDHSQKLELRDAHAKRVYKAALAKGAPGGAPDALAAAEEAMRRAYWQHSSDADLVVDPAHLGDLAARLEQLGNSALQAAYKATRHLKQAGLAGDAPPFAKAVFAAVLAGDDGRVKEIGAAIRRRILGHQAKIGDAGQSVPQVAAAGTSKGVS